MSVVGIPREGNACCAGPGRAAAGRYLERSGEERGAGGLPVAWASDVSVSATLLRLLAGVSARVLPAGGQRPDAQRPSRAHAQQHPVQVLGWVGHRHSGSGDPDTVRA